MSKVGYLFNRIRQMHFDRMLVKAREISAASGRRRFAILADMVYCGFRYQAGYMDYALFEMHNKNSAQRSSILTRGRNNAYVALLNSREDSRVFDDKVEFHKLFREFTRRDFIWLEKAGIGDFAAFAAKHPRFVAKPPDGTHGDGVEIIEAADIGSELEGLYRRLLAGRQRLCEELVIQHQTMAALNSGAVNTVRIVTILKDGHTHIVTAMLRIGGAGRQVDNFNNGGMVVPVEIETGTVAFPAMEKSGRVYTSHPASGTAIVGFQVPLWQECLALVRRAAEVVPSVRYVGWDVAVTPKGPLIIEGNPFPGHDIYGLPPHAPDGMGILPRFAEIIPLR